MQNSHHNEMSDGAYSIEVRVDAKKKPAFSEAMLRTSFQSGTTTNTASLHVCF
jgi:hypothetical protein